MGFGGPDPRILNLGTEKCGPFHCEAVSEDKGSERLYSTVTAKLPAAFV
jgi:hypothetical protein